MSLFRPWLPLLACCIGTALFTPTVRLVVWALLWVCAATGDYPAPPDYTPWSPM